MPYLEIIDKTDIRRCWHKPWFGLKIHEDCVFTLSQQQTNYPNMLVHKDTLFHTNGVSETGQGLSTSFVSPIVLGYKCGTKQLKKIEGLCCNH